MPTIFEKIIRREIPSYIVYEDELCIAFLDISQATKGHTLLVPKTAYENLYVLPENVAAHLFKTAVHLAKSIQKAFSCPGLNLLNNNGAIAGQSVFHFHLHLIPRYDKQDVQFDFSNHFGKIESEEYENRANLIKEALL